MGWLGWDSSAISDRYFYVATVTTSADELASDNCGGYAEEEDEGY